MDCDYLLVLLQQRCQAVRHPAGPGKVQLEAWLQILGYQIQHAGQHAAYQHLERLPALAT